MHVQLECRGCHHGFSQSIDTNNGSSVEQIFAEGPWVALGDGETIEDRIYAELWANGAMCCPRCGDPVNVREEDLAGMSLQLLGEW